MIKNAVEKITIINIVALFLLYGFISVSAEEEKAIKKAPDFTLRTIKGKNFKLSKNLGKGPIIINFWATWCLPCVYEMKEFKKINEKYKDTGLKIISISIDDTKTVGKVENFVRSRKYPFIIPLDINKKVYEMYHVSSLPQTFLLDTEGNIIYSHSGYRKGDEKKLEENLVALINKDD